MTNIIRENSDHQWVGIRDPNCGLALPMIHFLKRPDEVGQFALELLKQFALNPTFHHSGAVATASFVFDKAEAAFAELSKRGHMLDAPTLQEAEAGHKRSIEVRENRK